MRIPFLKYDHQKQLDELPKIVQDPNHYQILFQPSAYRTTMLDMIKQAKSRIYLVALYLERDEAGQEILEALYQAKQHNPALDIKIFVDWHRAQRGRIGENKEKSNANFYCEMKCRYPGIEIVVYGIPINRREVLGVLHLKGCIIDDTVLYSGASINNVYLHKQDKYRYDRYHKIGNKVLADSMINFVNQHLLAATAIQCLDNPAQPSRKEIKPDIKQLRHQLSHHNYQFESTGSNEQLSVSPIIGLGKKNLLNQTIHHLLNSVQHKVTLCTPYFNLPTILIKDIIRLMKKGKQVEIIVGDKTANDFYIPEDQPFNIIGGLPYLYEINLRKFMTRLQPYVDNGLLTVRLWKDEDNSYHLKGIWVDEKWVMITGNNLNPRAWRLDLENAILIHDPKGELTTQFSQELETIRQHTFEVIHYQQIQASQFYPKPVHKLIKRLSTIRIDKIIKRIL
ncbi:CDP-diacylglycerol--serine O-phosphatidyltransferase [Utexia brackfieldae]|uniref:CDP-diacylglycerol--serine O-phosphatidyltransferase n=1 Tax=Utexia brackfieldae TaxID=3074108 RepID=UPI00370D2619